MATSCRDCGPTLPRLLSTAATAASCNACGQKPLQNQTATISAPLHILPLSDEPPPCSGAFITYRPFAPFGNFERYGMTLSSIIAPFVWIHSAEFSLYM